ncbi:unnamed protein product [Spirodela intermedia]|uniref:Threonine dehydratase n=1 Tax=Spirodela intermedia TaxID=51605 RepID=A0ABN7E7Z0_SPIIN|nr:unnamed protein product [Spirodela intermedia]
MTINYREKIEHSHVYAVARHTPLDELPNLSSRLNNRVLLKREDMQPVFSFKLRGFAAWRDLRQCRNHAQGVALSAQKMGCRAVIVMPTTTPAIKLLRCPTCTRSISSTGGLTFVHPYDDPDVIAGQGTIALELLQDHAAPIEAVFCCVGGGGLLAGMAAYLKAVRPEIKVIGVEAQDAEAMTESLKLGQRVMLEQVGLFADGAAVKQVGEHTFALVQQYVDEMIVVDNDAICAAIKDVFEDTRSILEPAGALAVACQGKTLVAVASGANMNFDRLRFIAERAELGERRRRSLPSPFLRTPGAFKRFCRLLGQRNITEFNYRFADTEQAHIFCRVGGASPNRGRCYREQIGGGWLATINLSDNEMAKLHLRHLVAGMRHKSKTRWFTVSSFLKKPGALMNFLESMGHNWNISLFHYRNHGADFGRVLVGMQVPPEDQLALPSFYSNGLPYWDESHNPAYRLF